MRAAGVEVLRDFTQYGVIGIWDAVLSLPQIWAVYQVLRRLIRREAPDLIILIDSPGMNLRLARYARRLGIRTVYYFPPSAWSPRQERARRIAATVDHVVAAFAFTAEVYRKADAPVAYFGHPMIDLPLPPEPPDAIRERLGVPAGRRVVGILPGSRRPEIRRLGPILLRSARLLMERVPDVHFLVPVAAPQLRAAVERQVTRHGVGLPLTVLEGRGLEVMAAADLIVMASGSASLEAALLGAPMILMYRLAAFDWWVGHLVVSDFTYMGLPNLILQKPVVPEFIQHDATPERIAGEAETLLLDAERRQNMKDDLAEVKKQLGAPGVVDRVAHYVWETAIHGRGHHHQ